MKTRKFTKLTAILFALMACTFIACSDSSSHDDDDGEAKEYKVEVGQVNYADYEEIDNANIVYTLNAVKAQRDTLYSRTISGTYQDKGRLNSNQIKELVDQNIGEMDGAEEVAESHMAYADQIGNMILFAFPDTSYQTAMWIYIEK
ncbi:MAG: hypothetical protein J6W63_00110 [Treponema sp.]|nr:hypothetical protein [Treponema sp.]